MHLDYEMRKKFLRILALIQKKRLSTMRLMRVVRCRRYRTLPLRRLALYHRKDFGDSLPL
jgi:hypothetical protein